MIIKQRSYKKFHSMVCSKEWERNMPKQMQVDWTQIQRTYVTPFLIQVQATSVNSSRALNKL